MSHFFRPLSVNLTLMLSKEEESKQPQIVKHTECRNEIKNGLA